MEPEVAVPATARETPGENGELTRQVETGYNSAMDENPYEAPQVARTHAGAERRRWPWFAYIAGTLAVLALALNCVGIVVTPIYGYAAWHADTSPRETAMAVFVAGLMFGIQLCNIWLLSARTEPRPIVQVLLSVMFNATLIAFFAQFLVWPSAPFSVTSLLTEVVAPMSIGVVSILAVVVRSRIIRLSRDGGIGI